MTITNRLILSRRIPSGILISGINLCQHQDIQPGNLGLKFRIRQWMITSLIKLKSGNKIHKYNMELHDLLLPASVITTSETLLVKK